MSSLQLINFIKNLFFKPRILQKNLKRLNKEQVGKIKNQSGVYFIYDNTGEPIYVGVSEILKHRLQSYYQKDDFTVNRTKRKLRHYSYYFSVKYCSIQKARLIEMENKYSMRFNHL